MNKLILTAEDGTMTEHHIADAENFDALNSGEYVLFIGSTPYTFHDANENEIIYKARSVRVLIGVKTNDMAVMEWSIVEPDLMPETTSPEVASKAGMLMGMSAEDMASAAIEQIGPDDDSAMTINAEFHALVRSVAASALTQAAPRGPVPPIDFPRSKSGLPLAISDLFFNHEHPQYDTVKGNLSPKTKADNKHTREALLTDATEFAQSMAAAGNPGIDPAALVEDFFDRL